jgi:hypothetical protein
MNQRLKLVLYGIILLVGGIAVGRMIGMAEAYKKTSQDLADQYYRRAAANLNTHLGLLQTLQSNEKDKAAQQLVRLVDVDVMALSRKSEIPAERRPEIERLLAKAKEVRQKTPAPATK